MLIRDNLISRFRFEGAQFAPIRNEMVRLLDTSDAIREHHRTLQRDGRFTPLGLQDEMRAYLAKEAFTNLHVAARSIEKVKNKIAAKRASLAPKAPDRNDLAGAVVRSELRTMLREMPATKRIQVLMSPEADPVMHAAVLEAPNVSSGIDDKTRNQVTSAIIEREHPGALAAIAQLEDALTFLEQTTMYAKDTVRAAGEFPTLAMMDDFVKAAVGEKASAIDACVEQYFRPLMEAA